MTPSWPGRSRFVIVLALVVGISILGRPVPISSADPVVTKVADVNLPLAELGSASMPVVNGKILMTLGDSLVASDGSSAGVETIATPDEGAPFQLTKVNDQLAMFVAGGTSRRLWRTDGTSAGTYPVTGMSAPDDHGGTIDYLTPIGNQLYFSFSGGPDQFEPWISDGSLVGTREIKDINPTSGSLPHGYTLVGGAVYFTANDGTHGGEVWRTDGSEAGTAMLKDIRPSLYDYAGNEPANYVDVAGRLYFTAAEGSGGVDLWTSDGSETGTIRLTDLAAGGGQVASLVGIGDTLYFNGCTSGASLSCSLYRSDGTQVGTTLIAHTGQVLRIIEAGGLLYFLVDDGVHGEELWSSDGTEAQTQMLFDLNPGPATGVTDLVNVGGEVFFTGNDGVHGFELYRLSTAASAGLAPATMLASESTRVTLQTTTTATQSPVLIADINPNGSSSPDNLAVKGDRLFFAATDSTGHHALFSGSGLLAPDIVSVVPPTFTGTGRVGEPLTGSTGTWTVADATLSFQWFANGTVIAGASSPGYVPDAAVLGATITLRVTASRPGFNTTTANAARSVTIVPGVIRNLLAPKIAGKRKVGKVLSASTGSWDPGTPTVRYQWLRNGKPIASATKRTYRLTRASRGKRISVRVTAVRAGYDPAVAVSAKTTRIT